MQYILRRSQMKKAAKETYSKVNSLCQRKLQIYLITTYLGLFLLLGCKCAKVQQTRKNWNDISTYFNPPTKYYNKYRTYRSPLLFYNGNTVKSTSDWLTRRAEIKEKWMILIDQWPPIINNQKFEILDSIKRENVFQYSVRFYWTPNEKTKGYLLIPDKKGKKSAIITVFYEPEMAIGLGGKKNRDFAYQLTKKGFITLSLGTTQTTQNKTDSLYYPTINNATLQPLSASTYAVANAWEALAKVEEVDSTRIGIIGHSYGGKWAMLASCLYDKFSCAVWSDPGIVFDETKGNYINYWTPWYLGYYPTPWKEIWRNNIDTSSKGAYSILRKNGHDLHELHSLMAPRPFLVSGGYSDSPDRWLALNHTIQVNHILGYNNRVAMTNRPRHDPSSESNEVICNFFEWYLKRP